MATGQSTYFDDKLYFDDSNPLRNFVGQCTWYCWSKAKAKAIAYPERDLKYANLPVIDAHYWYGEAPRRGFSVSKTPRADSIACWSSQHVAYVETWDGNDVCFTHANWYGNKSGSLKIQNGAFQMVKSNVAKHTSKVTVYTADQNGGDGYFETRSRSSFENMKPGFQGYIYLS